MSSATHSQSTPCSNPADFAPRRSDPPQEAKARPRFVYNISYEDECYKYNDCERCDADPSDLPFRRTLMQTESDPRENLYKRYASSVFKVQWVILRFVAEAPEPYWNTKYWPVVRDLWAEYCGVPLKGCIEEADSCFSCGFRLWEERTRLIRAVAMMVTNTYCRYGEFCRDERITEEFRGLAFEMRDDLRRRDPKMYELISDGHWFGIPDVDDDEKWVDFVGS